MKAGDVVIQKPDTEGGLLYVKVLKEEPDASGLVECTSLAICVRDGKRVFYSVDSESTIDISEYVQLIEAEKVSA